MSNKEIIIRLNNISKIYKLYNKQKDRVKEAFLRKNYHVEFEALKDISFEVQKGEILGIVGKNGSGKSTLLKIISGILQPNSGTMEVNGRVIPLIELGAGFHPEYSGIENIYFYGTINGINRKEMKKYLDEIIAFADIGQFIDQPLKTYSSGMKARLAFAASTIIQPEILILDEVLSVGDVAFRRKSFAKMESLIKSGVTVIIVSHSPETILRICDRVILIDDGRLLMTGSPKYVVPYYSRLLFAKPGAKQNILDEIKSSQQLFEESKNNLLKAELKKAEGGIDIPKGLPKLEELEDKYLADFESKSIKIVKKQDIDILEYSIFNIKDEKVNLLVFNNEYTFNLKLHTNVEIKNPNFLFTIKDLNGISISRERVEGLQVGIQTIKEDTVFDINWTFQNLLNPENYFITVSITHLPEKKQRQLFLRIEDVMLFTVQDYAPKGHEGYVYLKQDLELIIEGEQEYK